MVGRLQGHKPPKAMADHKRLGRQGRLANGKDLSGKGFAAVTIAVVRVPVARKVQGRHGVFSGEVGGEEAPPVAMGVATVNQHHAGCPFRAGPALIGDGGAIDGDSASLAGMGEAEGQPGWGGHDSP